MTATCRYLTDCPTGCHGPETNRLYVKDEKKEVKEKLDEIDRIQHNGKAEIKSFVIHCTCIRGEIKRVVHYRVYHHSHFTE